jgi:peptidoglycan/LPS O-acetylase OafA/YrhL
VGITALALQAVYLHSVLHCNPHGLPGEQKWHPLKVQLYAVFMYYGSPLLAVTTCMGLMALMLHSDPMHAALSSGLSSPLLTPLSKLSYCVYLVAELARLWGVTLLVPAGVLPALIAVSPYTALMAICLFTLACSYACAFVLHHLVEKPFFRWL